MTQIICSPTKYIQGHGEIRKLGDYCSQLGATRAYAIIDPYIFSVYKKEITYSFEMNEMPLVMTEFKGECSSNQVNEIVAALGLKDAEVIIGIGGGKTLDTAKAVSHMSNLPVVIVPTVASTDAPCSALSVLYTDEGDFDCYLPLKRNPDLVIVDVDIIAKAPARLLVAGMGDALSTFYEARACRESGAITHAGGTSTIAALSLARACLDTLLAEGETALKDVKQGITSPAVEHIIEANIYLSGIGFESGGLAAAHAIHNGLTLHEECRNTLHGEKVAFATIVQLVLEKTPYEEIDQVIDFCKKIGLPVTLKDLGITNKDIDQLMTVAEASCSKDSPIWNMPIEIQALDVLEAILAADARGQ
ncbi:MULTISPECIES: glycerol dehydrogenase [Paenibacillus]|uniref:Glycerol dehydrogenase n=1 Tax=Paenibacillus odorifer TaxID=189426 RepID=A0A1R0XDV7_9BACL|nr:MULTISPECIES: glycerol dehydrogenase [Paenibacillus]AIQ73684.1 glycerol dehydrogenase [Paenibacillus odorifer]ETT45391.1 iron-containing alcohol dehydrogenase [Paenibacillus sp. FSL H8-237]OMD33242.1 glycerol dehydrogenase [Paenibacillus odorifer]OME56239.1 glycerol dehydrogenase [Paenibacillus odorifer]OME59721.1 glycerol dehydrogenase [Paenibacillus odorifer]